eukprot:2481904-Pyramimonas_sp.AAC.1
MPRPRSSAKSDPATPGAVPCMSSTCSSTRHGGSARNWGAVSDRSNPLAMSCSAANSTQCFPPARRPGSCFASCHARGTIPGPRVGTRPTRPPPRGRGSTRPPHQQ